jgi:hypothetical protein
MKTLHDWLLRLMVGESEEPKIKFPTYLFADVATAYLEASDLPLIGKGAPHYLVGANGEAIFSTREAGKAALDYGFSERFVSILRELDNQDIPLVQFSRKGGRIEGLPPGSAANLVDWIAVFSWGDDAPSRFGHCPKGARISLDVRGAPQPQP